MVNLHHQESGDLGRAVAHSTSDHCGPFIFHHIAGSPVHTGTLSTSEGSIQPGYTLQGATGDQCTLALYVINGSGIWTWWSFEERHERRTPSVTRLRLHLQGHRVINDCHGPNHQPITDTINSGAVLIDSMKGNAKGVNSSVFAQPKLVWCDFQEVRMKLPKCSWLRRFCYAIRTTVSCMHDCYKGHLRRVEKVQGRALKFLTMILPVCLTARPYQDRICNCCMRNVYCVC